MSQSGPRVLPETYTSASILIVDDDRINCLVLSRHLERLGHRAVTTGGGREALEILETRTFDLVLLDIIMPEMDGFQVLHILKSTPAWQPIPVIAISGLEDQQSAVRCIELGAEDLLTKPFEPALLKARITASLEKKRLHDVLTKTLTEVVVQRDSIEAINTQILDSIRYARSIQQAMLPQAAALDDVLADYFVIYRPKDIVSGDFYWYHFHKSETATRLLVAVADCTGHGVPGAFMSMIGTTLLNQIVREKQIHDPALILEHLHRGIQLLLRQTDETGTAQDGMDIALCAIEGNTVTFAGARRPLYFIQRTPTGTPDLHEVKGDRKTIGGRQRDAFRRFTACAIEVGEETMLYLTTDGFADQSNGMSGRYGSKRLKRRLAETAHLSPADQRRELLDDLASFQGDEPQRDDITVLALRVPIGDAPGRERTGSFTLTWDITL